MRYLKAFYLLITLCLAAFYLIFRIKKQSLIPRTVPGLGSSTLRPNAILGTSRNVKSQTGRVIYDHPFTYVYGDLTPRIAIFTSPYTWQSLFEASCDLYGSYTLMTWGGLLVLWRLFYCLLNLALKHFREVLISVTQSLEQMDERRRCQLQLECIARKATISPKARRQYGRHLRTPLLKRRNQDLFDLWLLPEEPVHIRHMYNPLYFNYVKKIGKGSYGSIYQVEHRITGKMMAIKKLSKGVHGGEEADVEIRALTRLQDTLWTPTVLSTFKNGSGFYILMPLYKRGDLYTFMLSCGGCLSRALAKFYLTEMLLGIHAIHQHGIIHRDLKPENILFTDDGHLIIADFGVAHVFHTNDDGFLEDEFPLWANARRMAGDDFPLLTPSYDNPHTTRGNSGTFFYTAPEVQRQELYSYGVDYYAMGVLYHEMITGYVPYRYDESTLDRADSKMYLSFERHYSHLQNVSLADLDFLGKALNSNPYKRPSVSEMKAHPVFSDINWIDLALQCVPVPPVTVMRKRVSQRDAFERCLTSGNEQTFQV